MRFQAFGVGCAKTGTASLAKMFKDHYRSEHEAKALVLIKLILRRGEFSAHAFGEAVHAIVDPLNLEMNSSQINGYIIETMVAMFPQAKFVLTLRDPREWVRSFVNHQMTRPIPAPDSPWAQFRDLRFRPNRTSERPSDGFYTRDQYLSYWLAHNVKVIRTVPADRLLIVRTERLDSEIPRLASFLGIPEHTITSARANEGAYDVNVGFDIDEDQLSASSRKYAMQFREATGLEMDSA